MDQMFPHYELDSFGRILSISEIESITRISYGHVIQGTFIHDDSYSPAELKHKLEQALIDSGWRKVCNRGSQSVYRSKNGLSIIDTNGRAFNLIHAKTGKKEHMDAVEKKFKDKGL